MTKKAQALLAEVLKLSAAEKISLADQLLANLEESGDFELTPEFASELERRANTAPPSGGKWPTGDEVVDGALRRLKSRRRSSG